MRVLSRLPLLSALALASACSEYASTGGPEHCGAIDSQVWGRDLNPHDVTCDVTVTGDLTIGPNTRVRFAAGTSLIVQGSLRIEGTEDQPVRFESAEDGVGWVGVWVRGWDDQDVEQRPTLFSRVAGSPPSATSTLGQPQGEVHIEWLEISGAGISPEGGGLKAALTVDRGPVRMADVTIDGARQCGISLGAEGLITPVRGDDGALAVDRTVATIAAPAEEPLCVDAQAVSGLPRGLVLDEGAVVEVTGTTLQGGHTWRNLGVPLKITEPLTLQSGSLTVEAGARVEMMPDTSLTVGADVERTYGQARGDSGPLVMDSAARLELAGTDVDPVVFTVGPSASDAPYWDRLRFDGTGGSPVTATLRHVRLESGGAGTTSEPATVEILGDAEVILDDVEIVDGGGAGLRLTRGGRIGEGSSGLTVSGNAYPAYVTPDALLSLPTDGSTYTGNDSAPSAGSRPAGDVIWLESGAFSASGTWPDLGTDYGVEGDLAVQGGPTGETTTLSIDPGLDVTFPAGASFSVGTAGPATLIAGDAEGDDLVFRTADGVTSWEGLVLGTSLQEGTRLANVRVEGAGGAGWAVDAPGAAILIDGLSIVDSVQGGLRLRGTFAEGSQGLSVTGSEGTAIEAAADAAGTLPGPGADISGNGRDRIEVDGSAVTISGTWSDLGVPYRVERQLRVTGRVDEAGVPFPARLTMEPGVEVQFGFVGALRTESISGEAGVDHGSIALLGTAEAPVRLLEGDAGQYWTGVLLTDEDLEGVPESSKSVLEHVVIDRAGGGAGAQASLTYRDSTPASVVDVTISNGQRYGIALIDNAYVDNVGTTEEPIRCDRFTKDPYTFVDNYPDPDVPIEDPDLIDFRVFLVPGDDPACL